MVTVCALERRGTDRLGAVSPDHWLNDQSGAVDQSEAAHGLPPPWGRAVIMCGLGGMVEALQVV